VGKLESKSIGSVLNVAVIAVVRSSLRLKIAGLPDLMPLA